MADVTLSKSVRSNLLNLQNTANLLSKTQQRLATGLKVNSALDNPTNFFTASSLNSRAGDLSRLLDAVSNATQTIEAANNGLTAIQKVVETAQATARQALQSAGQQTSNRIVGDTSAPYNPQALSLVTGDNTGTGALVADTPATIDFAAIAEDLANIPTINTADISGGGTNATALDSIATPLVDNDSIAFNVNGVSYTLNITDDGATGAARAGNATAGYTIDLDQDATIADLDDVLNTLLTGSGTTVTDNADGTLSFAFASTVNSVVLSDGVGDGSDLAALGLNAVGADRTFTAGNTGDRVLAKNTAFQAELAARDGQTLAVEIDGVVIDTLTFGTGPGQIATKDGLVAALNAVNGVSATNAGGGGAITINITDSNDAESVLSFNASASELNTFLAFDVAGDDGGIDLDSQTGLRTTSNPNNLLTQGAVADGDTIDIKVGAHATTTITFGTGAGEVRTIAELNAELASLAGGAASVDARGEINITSDKAGDSIVIGGTTTALTSFGLTEGSTNNLLTAGTGIVEGDQLNIQVGTHTMLTITFGTGTGEVSSLEELEAALGNLAGGTATIDDNTGAITVNATNGADTITITSNDNVAAPDDAVADAFGLNNSTTPVDPVVVDNVVRRELEKQFNTLLSQVTELAEDAGFNGINLLNGNDLNVIFNEDGSSTLSIKGVVFNAAGLGLSSVSAGYFQTDVNVENTLESLETASATLRGQASTFGSNLSVVETRQDFTNRMINTLESGAANLTLADTNEEAANLLALQTRQQLSQTALSLASETDQSVLRLFS